MPPSNAASPARRSFRGVLPEERRAQRRRQLVEAGLEAFGTRGFHAAGVRDICAIAKLTERYFYESFENREALFLAVYEEAVDGIRTLVTAALENAPPSAPALARAALRAALEAYRGDPRLARILLIEVLAVGAVVGQAQLLVSGSFAELIEGGARRVYPDLAGRGLDPRIVASGLYGSTFYVAMRWTLEGFREPLETVLDHCALFYEAFAAEMDRRPPRVQSCRVPAKEKPKRKSRRP